MAAAIAKGRETLPEFWKSFEHPAKDETGFALKVKITDANGDEHFWATQIQRTNNVITGVIDNDPDIVKSVKQGQRIEIPPADISDWLFIRGKKMIGNATIKPLLKSLSKEEADYYRSIMADP